MQAYTTVQAAFLIFKKCSVLERREAGSLLRSAEKIGDGIHRYLIVTLL